MKRRNYHRPKASSGWYHFSLNKGKNVSFSTALELREDNEIHNYEVRPFCTKYVNGIRID